MARQATCIFLTMRQTMTTTTRTSNMGCPIEGETNKQASQATYINRAEPPAARQPCLGSHRQRCIPAKARRQGIVHQTICSSVIVDCTCCAHGQAASALNYSGTRGSASGHGSIPCHPRMDGNKVLVLFLLEKQLHYFDILLFIKIELIVFTSNLRYGLVRLHN